MSFIQQRRLRAVATTLLVVLGLAGCSGSGGASDEAAAEPITAEPITDDPVNEIIDDAVTSEIEPEALTLLRGDPTLISAVPEVVHSQTMADSGLQITYVSENLIAEAPASTIERQWIFMIECIGQITSPPVVMVREGPAVPFTANDDVVRNESLEALIIGSTPIASATPLYGTVIQISDSDFDGSIGTAGFNLRSIMGRHLYFSAGLPERDYPFSCAQQQP